MSPESDPSAAPLQERVDRERIRLFAGQAVRVLGTLLPLDGFLIWLLARSGLLLPALVWAGVGAVLQTWRWRVSERPTVTAAQVQDKLTQLNLQSALLGLVRASIIPLLFSIPVTSTHYVYTMVLVGQLAGAVGSLGSLFRAYLYWATPLVVSISVAWWTQGSFEGRGVAVLMFALFGILAGYVKNSERTLRQLVEFAYLKEGLVTSLRAERDRAEEAGRANEVLASSLLVERDRAEAASMSKTRFFAAASHDLRQPLHALSINATTLELVVHRHSDSMLLELSQGINRALAQSNRLLQGLLDISRLDAGAVEVRLEVVDANRLIRVVADEFGPLAEKGRLSLSCDGVGDAPRYVDTDPELMLRILNNLVSNALKFTTTGAVVVYARTVTESVHVLGVRDTGVGIPEAEREKVFEEFYQIGNPSRDRSEGLGLGLSIVRRTATLLGATVTLHSEVGQGTRIEVALPAVASEMPLSEPTPHCASPAALRARVLAIDDEVDILLSMKRLLLELGCDARCVTTLLAAHECLDGGFLPEILLVDFRLRIGDGIEAIQDLQRRLGGVPAVLVTGDTLPQVLQKAGYAGLRVLHKPVDGKKLAQTLAEAMGA